jgi:aspartyl-tRNA(Asn)/glutamyl-tRNA(Gln) amidotransferase subunit C
MSFANVERQETMKIKPEEVDYVALLGRLALGPDEKQKFITQLDDILKYMDMLSEVETSNVEPMAGPVELCTPLRDDVVGPSLPIEEALANAPARSGTSFRVPKIID